MLRFVSCMLALAPASALAGPCENARLDLPPTIADAVRPYVICGMISRASGDVATQVNGVSASLRGPPGSTGPGACANIRTKAAQEAGQGLLTSIPEQQVREQYVERVLQDADRFIAASQASDSIGIDPAERIAACTQNKTGTTDQ